ncbi:MAG: type II toxin-antitoxin system RelE/ParE family toxin [Bdellovibrionales bacterium]|nr:type II toxin-antitoxin system RelE/ParE family toxin [Bdellovibrionales bacterium]
MTTRSIEYYVTSSGKAPFLEWMNKLDMNSQIIVDRYIQRVAQGGAKKSIKNLKGGLFEIKIPYGSGLRVYFGEEERKLILLLMGGDKKKQKRDIQKAHEYWEEQSKS